MNRARAICAALVYVAAAACSGTGNGPSELPPPPTAGSGSGGGPPSSAPPVLFVGAGDIANCDTVGARETAKLLDVLGGTVFTTGDNAYPGGTADEFRRCYDPTWGRHRGRTRPSPGNHDYNVPGAAAYFNYFGHNAGPTGLGYYSYDLGAWHVISLNSEIAAGPGSAQEQWLRQDLAANASRCTVAYWHRPLFSSGHGGHDGVRALWRALYEFDADLVLTGHDHYYERFAPQDPDGRADQSRGIRQFVIGTGGTTTTRARAAVPNTEIQGSDWGVLALTLESNGYRWEFVPVAGATFRDAGIGSCH